VHFAQLLVQPGTLFLRLKDFFLPLFNLLADSLQLTLVFECFERASSVLHDLSEPFIAEQSGDKIPSVTKVLDSFDVGLDLLFEVFDLSLIL
jgi:hypothetical protein